MRFRQHQEVDSNRLDFLPKYETRSSKKNFIQENLSATPLSELKLKRLYNSNNSIRSSVIQRQILDNSTTNLYSSSSNPKLHSLERKLDSSLMDLPRNDKKYQSRKQLKYNGSIPDQVSKHESFRMNKQDLARHLSLIELKKEDKQLEKELNRWKDKADELKDTMDQRMDMFAFKQKSVHKNVSEDLETKYIEQHMESTKQKPTNYALGIDLQQDDLYIY